MTARLLLLVVSALACATPGVPRQELPADPIAIMYWSREDARRRNEVIEQAGPRATRVGVANVETLGGLFGAGKSRGSALDELQRWPGRLSLLDPVTGAVTRIAAAAPDARPLSWSEDHQRLLFVSARGKRRPQLYEYDRGTGDVRAVTHGEESHPKGDYGPDGRLAYLGFQRFGESLRSRLYVTGPHGGNPRPVLEGEAVDTPRFSPDGERVIFARTPPSAPNRRATPLIVSRDPNSGEEKVLGRGKDPDFSSDGNWIVYSARAGNLWKLARMRPDGTGRTPLGSGLRDEESPTVSPDGRFVAYIAQEGEFDLVFVRRMDGSGERPLFDAGAAAWPVW